MSKRNNLRDNTPIFLIITSKGCGHCTRFKNNELRDLREKLEADGNVNVIEIEYENVDISKYHPELKNIIYWFPLFILITRESWENYKSPLQYIILGAKYKDGKLDVQHSGITAKTPLIYDALQEALNVIKIKFSRDGNNKIPGMKIKGVIPKFSSFNNETNPSRNVNDNIIFQPLSSVNTKYTSIYNFAPKGF